MKFTNLWHPSHEWHFDGTLLVEEYCPIGRAIFDFNTMRIFNMSQFGKISNCVRSSSIGNNVVGGLFLNFSLQQQAHRHLVVFLSLSTKGKAAGWDQREPCYPFDSALLITREFLLSLFAAILVRGNTLNNATAIAICFVTACQREPKSVFRDSVRRLV